MREKGCALGARVKALGERGTGFRYPAALRQEITAYLVEARQTGVRWGELEAWLAIGTPTLTRWHQARQEQAPPPQFLALTLKQETPTPTAPASLALVTPDGFRLEGLDLDTALTLLRRLGS